MSITVNGNTVSVVHVRHDGRSHDIDMNSENMPEGELTQEELFAMVEDQIDSNRGSLNDYVFEIVSSTETIVIHPQAKFGRTI